ncbi:hypothetical protein OF83DRAFT_1081044 [Amylostereum chailletii]|nr:hypothetical protein OF83DRAFT_1081044 [Amylostereum chailletii]
MYQMHDQDMDGLWVGPQPPNQFINNHTPKPPASAPAIPNKGLMCFEEDSQVDESTLIRALKPYCPNISIEDTHNLHAHGEYAETFRQVEMNVLDEADNPQALATPSTSISLVSPASSQAPSSSTPSSSALDGKRIVEILSKSFLFFKLKYKNPQGEREPCEDVFDAPRGQENRRNLDPRYIDRESQAAREEMTSYVMAMFKSGHRVFTFSVLIMHEEARLMRWDRSGAIFSERFNWQTTTYLTKFLWRFNFMTPAQRGFDTTVSMPSDQEIRLAHGAFDAARKRLSYHTLPDKNETLRRFEVWDGNDCHVVIAGQPQSYPDTLPGRSTSGYIGIDITDTATPTVVYLKDTWQISLPGIPVEGEVYQRLNKKKVPYLPDYRYGGDVPLVRPYALTRLRPNRKAQVTVTQDYATKDWAYNTEDVNPLTHHRIVLGKIGRPLHTFKVTKEFCQVLFHALTCHRLAYEDAQTLHQDISAGNILIDEDGNGMLIDWDLCWCMDVPSDPQWRRRTGTIQSMSVALFKEPFKRDHLLRDDLESFVHVLFYHVLKYRPTQCGRRADFALTFFQVFDAYTEGNDNEVVGGDMRKSMILNSVFTSDDLMTSSDLPRPLISLMNAARNLFKPLYLPQTQREPWEPFYPPPGLFSPEVVERVNKSSKLAWEASQKAEAQRESRIKDLKSSIPLWRIFNHYLRNPGWRNDDGAQIQLPRNGITSVSGDSEPENISNHNGRRKRSASIDEEGAVKRLRRNDRSKRTLSPPGSGNTSS